MDKCDLWRLECSQGTGNTLTRLCRMHIGNIWMRINRMSNNVGGANCPPASMFAGVTAFCSLVSRSTFSSRWAFAHLVRWT